MGMSTGKHSSNRKSGRQLIADRTDKNVVQRELKFPFQSNSYIEGFPHSSHLTNTSKHFSP